MRRRTARCIGSRVVVVLALLPLSKAASQDTGSAPVYRQHHAITYDPATRRVMLYGGLSRDLPRVDAPPLDDLWSWDGRRWTGITERAGLGLVGHLLFADGAGGLFVTAGAPHRVTGRWDGQKWSIATSDSGRARDLAAGSYDTRRKRFVLFGGRDSSRARSGDTWEFDGRHWTKMATGGPGGPPSVVSAAMAYDERRRVATLFGGGAGPNFFGDTWTWDGTRWERVATAGPTPRIAAGIAYDSYRGEVILFGGYDSTGWVGDTWIWNGNAWRKAEVEGPSPRSDGMMAYDAERAVVVLFGGVGASGKGLGDTWEWDGTRWRQRAPETR